MQELGRGYICKGFALLSFVFTILRGELVPTTEGIKCESTDESGTNDSDHRSVILWENIGIIECFGGEETHCPVQPSLG